MKIKILKLSIIISLLSAYTFTGKTEDGFALQYGYPINFFTLYNSSNKLAIPIINRSSINILLFILNIFIIYLILYLIFTIWNRIKAYFA